jgi:hypothetical protein
VAEETNVTGEFASGMRSIVERVGEFLHVFDLSFFVAGAPTFGALAFVYLEMGKPRVFPFAPWVGGLALILACYVCGMVAFAAGRMINSGCFRRRRTLSESLCEALRGHRLTSEVIAAYLSNQPGEQPDFWWLHQRMQSEVAQVRSAQVVRQHLMRSWAMAATYDGVAFSFLVWAVGVVFTERSIFGAVAFVAFLGAACVALKRGAQYYKDQIQVAVAYFAVATGPLV